MTQMQHESTEVEVKSAATQHATVVCPSQQMRLRLSESANVLRHTTPYGIKEDWQTTAVAPHSVS